MILPVAKMTMPSCLARQSNGKLPDSLLVDCGIKGFRMAPPAARAMKAMVAAMEAAGFRVRATGTYRSYERQVALFLERYSPKPIEGRPIKVWNGTRYWQKPGTAMAAVPGTSNHGWALAVDFAEERDGDPQVESVSTAMVTWLVKNALHYGYSAEAQSEPWHWRYVAGDAVLPKVEAYHAGNVETPTTITAPQPQPQPAPATPVLKIGSKGDAVKTAQRLLNQKGANPPVVEDGQFGPKTATAVKAFQKANGIKQTGNVATQTWAALLS